MEELRVKGERVDWIDALKAFAIFLVTLGHVFGGLGHNRFFARNLIYSFHMPLFFAISGYVAAYVLVVKNDDVRMSLGEVGGFMRRKFHTLIVPYVLFPLLLYPIFYGRIMDPEYFPRVSKSIFIDNTGAWFLPCLFLLMLAFAVSALVRSRWVRLPLWVVLLITQVFATGTHVLTGNPFLRSMSSYMLPFSIGIYLAYKPRIIELCQKSVSLIMLFAVFAVSSVGFAHVVVLDGGSAALMGKVCRMVAGVSAIPLVFVLFSLIKTNAMTRVLSVVGKSTLVIYLFQDTPISYAKIFKVENAGIGMVCLALCISVVVICQGVAIKWLLERSKVLSFLFLGRRWRG